MPKQYNKIELAEIVRSSNPQYAGLSDDSVLNIAMHLQPELKSRLIPEPAPAPQPGVWANMKDLAEAAMKRVGGQIGAVGGALEKPVGKIREALKPAPQEALLPEAVARPPRRIVEASLVPGTDEDLSVPDFEIGNRSTTIAGLPTRPKMKPMTAADVALAQNKLQVERLTGIPAEKVKRDTMLEVARESGAGTQPTLSEIGKAGINVGMVYGLGSALGPAYAAGRLVPVLAETGLNLGIYTALEKMVPVEKFIPEDAGDTTKTAIEMADFLVKGVFAGVGAKGALLAGRYAKAKMKLAGVTDKLGPEQTDKIISSAVENNIKAETGETLPPKAETLAPKRETGPAAGETKPGASETFVQDKLFSKQPAGSKPVGKDIEVTIEPPKKILGMDTGFTLRRIVDGKQEASGFNSLAEVYDFANKYGYTIKGAAGETKGSAAPAGAQGISSLGWSTPMPTEKIGDANGIFKNDIIRYAEKAFNVPIRGKATYRMGKYAGFFFPKNRIIRMKTWGELEPMTHEVAHAIDQSLIKGQWGRNFSKTAMAELQALDYNPKLRRANEGFAEWFRYAMTSEEAGKKAPVFTREWQQKIEAQPRLQADIALLRDKFQEWKNSGAVERMSRHIDMRGETLPKETLLEKAKASANKLYDEWVDEFGPLERIEKEAGIDFSTFHKVTPFQMATFAKGKAASIARTFVENAAIDENGNRIGKSLKEIIQPIIPIGKSGFVDQAKFKEFLIYGVAKRGLNLLKRGIEPGFDKSDMLAVVNRFKNPKWDQALDEITQWSHNLNGWLLRAGRYSPEEMKAIESVDPVYLKFARAISPQEMRASAGSGGGGVLGVQTPIKGMHGSGRAIINPLESMINSAATTILAAQKTRIARYMTEFSELFPQTYGRHVTRVPAPQKAVRFSAEKLKDFLRNENVDISELDFEKMVTIFQQDLRGRGNIVPIVDAAGKRHFYEVDPELYAALNSVDPIKLDSILAVLAPFARLARAGAVGLKASFGLITNPVRDTQTFAMLSQVHKDPLSAIVAELAGVKADVFAKEGTPAWKYGATGGKMAGFYGSAIDRTGGQKVYEEMLLSSGKFGSKAFLVAKHPLDAAMRLFNVMEMGPRVAELTGMLKQIEQLHPEWSAEKKWVTAFNAAQDVTVNFTRSGRRGKKLNQVTAFFNANIQGPQKVYRAYKANPAMFTSQGLAYLTLPAMALWYKNKDKDWYKNLPYSYRLKNLWVETDNAIIRIPTSFELGTLFQALPIAVADYHHRQDPEVFKGLRDIGISQFPSVVPSMIGPVWDVARDQDYLGRPIEGLTLKRLPVEERVKEYTTSTAKYAAQGLNAFGVGLSPVQIDYLLNSYTGGVMRDYAFMKNGINEPADMPIVGVLAARTPQKPARQLEKFFADFKKLGQRQAAGTISDRDKGRLVELRAVYNYGIKQLYDQIDKAQEKHDAKRVNKLYSDVRVQLEKAGYQ